MSIALVGPSSSMEIGSVQVALWTALREMANPYNTGAGSSSPTSIGHLEARWDASSVGGFLNSIAPHTELRTGCGPATGDGIRPVREQPVHVQGLGASLQRVGNLHDPPCSVDLRCRGSGHATLSRALTCAGRTRATGGPCLRSSRCHSSARRTALGCGTSRSSASLMAASSWAGP